MFPDWNNRILFQSKIFAVFVNMVKIAENSTELLSL